MTKATVRVIQRKRLLSRTSRNAERVYRQRMRLLPIFVLVTSVLALVTLRVWPQASKTVSSVLESGLSGGAHRLSVLWSPVAIFIALSAAALLYMWMDFQHHKKPLIEIAPKTKYGLLHHLRVVGLPRLKYHWRPVFYWIAVAEVCVAVFIGTVVLVGTPSAKAFSGAGLGTEQSPYRIETCVQLQEMHDDLDGYYELAGPIDCTGTSSWNGDNGFSAIGTRSGDEFTGTLDGKGFAIDGLYQRVVDNDAPSGLLGSVAGATVHNLKLTNVDIASSTGGSTVAPFASEILNGQLSDISVTGTIQATGNDGAIYTSGFAGLVAVSTVSRVSVDVAIVNNSIDDDDEIGKAAWSAGLAFVLQMSTVTDSYTTGTIAGNFPAGGTAMYAGGFAGQILMGSVSNSYSSMSISITRNPSLDPAIMVVGGFATFVAAADISNTFATGQQSISVGSMVADYRGGLVGAVMFIEDADPPFNENITGSNNFYDITKANQAGCVGAYAGEELNVPVPDQTPGGFCSPVNGGNAQPNRFVNTSTVAPFRVGSTQVWDFTNTWKTQTTSLPIFVWQGALVPVLPGQVRNLTTTSSDSTSLTAQWLTPLSSGNTPITNYVVQYKLHSASSWTGVTRGSPTATSQLITGLAAGQLYDVRVAAVNAVGQSDWRVTENVQTSQSPSAPRSVVASGVAQTNEFAPFSFPELDWQAPEIGAPITDYVIQYKVNSGSDWDATVGELQDANMPWVTKDWVTVTDGTNTNLSFDPTQGADTDLMQAIIAAIRAEANVVDSIDFRIAAVNSHGQGAWSGVQNFQVFIGITACQQMHDELDQYRNSVFKILNNIDCNDTVNWNAGQGWSPVADESTPFQGVLDGQGYTVDGLFARKTTTGVVALISYIDKASIHDINLTDVDIRSTSGSEYSHVSALVGAAKGASIADISVQGTLSSNAIIAGVVGGVANWTEATTTLENLTFNGQLSGRWAGGIVGAVDDDGGTMTMSNTQSSGVINSDADTGGAIGIINNNNNTPTSTTGQITLTDISSTMQLHTPCYRTGGLIGSTQTSASTVNLVGSSYTGDIQCSLDNNSGVLNSVDRIVVDSQNRVYGLDVYNRLRRFSPTGEPEYLSHLSSLDGEASYALDLRFIDEQNNIYVSVIGESTTEIRKYNLAGQLLDSWDVPTISDITYRSNKVYVLSGHQVYTFGLDGQPIGSPFGEEGMEPGKIDVTSNNKIAVAPNGNIYVTCRSQQDVYSVQVFSPSGVFITQINSANDENNHRTNILDITIDDAGKVYVNFQVYHKYTYAPKSNRIETFDSSSSPTGYWPADGSTLRTAELFPLANGEFYMINPNDAPEPILRRYSSAGVLLDQWGRSTYVTNYGEIKYAGGLIGGHLGKPLYISGSQATGSLSAGDRGDGAFGGLVGISNRLYSGGFGTTTIAVEKGIDIQDSHSAVDITADRGIVFAGGLVGIAGAVDTDNAYATGDIVLGENATDTDIITGAAGGLLGWVATGNTDPSRGTIKNSHASGLVEFNTVNSTPTIRGPIVGGAIGMLTNAANIDTVYSTGEVRVDVRETCQDEDCDAITIVAGGLVGELVGADTNLAHDPTMVTNSYASSAITITGQTNLPGGGVTAGGLIGRIGAIKYRIDDSHATGNITILDENMGAVLGGLAGVAGAKNQGMINNSYATGTIASSAKSMSILPVWRAASGGLVGFLSGAGTIQKSYATGSISAAGFLGGLVGNSAWVYTPDEEEGRTLTNTYATGSVTGINGILVIGNEAAEMGSSVGGLVGYAGETAIQSSYASGALSVEKPDLTVILGEHPEFAEAAEGLYGAHIGGLVGVLVEALLGDSSTHALTTISNSFAASSVQADPDTHRGALFGIMMRVYDNDDPDEQEGVPADFLTNVYYDAHSLANLPCGVDVVNGQTFEGFHSGNYDDDTVCKPVNVNNQAPNYFRNNTTSPPLDTWDFGSPVWYSHVTTYPTFQAGESVPGPPRNLAGAPTTTSVALAWDPPLSDGGSPVVNYLVQYRVHGTNDWVEFSHPESTQRAYIITGLTPGTSYDFQVAAVNAVGQSTWILGLYDVLTSGNPTNPTDPTDPTTPTNPTNPTNPTGPTRPTTRPASGGGTATSESGGSPAEEERAPLDITKIPATEFSGIFAVAERTPKVSVVPYFFLSWLLLLALYFMYRAWRERQYRKAMDALIARTKNTEKNVSDFLAITTHYVNTPLSILKGAMELIASKHALQAEFVKQFQSKLQALQMTAASLTASNEQALQPTGAVVAESVDESSKSSTKQLWLPLAVIATAIAVTDIVLMFTRSYDQSWGRTLNHIIWAVGGTVAVLVSYAAWSRQKKLHASYRQELTRERNLLAQKNAFVGQAAQLLGDHATALRAGTAGLEQFPDTKLLTNGLAMLDSIAGALLKTQQFGVVHETLPNVNIREVYIRDIAPNLAEKAAATKVTITESLAADTVVQMQPEELGHVLTTTIQNAIEFSKPSGVVRLTSQLRVGKSVVTVQDNGTGMSADMQAHLFEPITRGVDTATFDHQGLGLSLYITKLVLEKYGGSIKVTSAPEKGTTVEMVLPKSVVDPTGVATQVIRPASSPM